jgi:DNA replication protein DnaC
MTLTVTLEKMRSMKLLHMAESLGRRLEKREQEGLSHEDFLALLVDDEYLGRQRSRLVRLHKRAAFKMHASLEELDYESSRGLRKAQVLEFTKPSWVENHQNVIITGATGVGKTYLACAIGNEGCSMGYPAGYFRTTALLQRMVEMRGTGNYTRFMEKMQRFKVLILDDLGISPLTQEETEDIMEIIEARDLCASTIVTTQLPKDKIYTAFADATLADAICDRLFRGAIHIPLKGESRRKAAPPKS